MGGRGARGFRQTVALGRERPEAGEGETSDTEEIIKTGSTVGANGDPHFSHASVATMLGLKLPARNRQVCKVGSQRWDVAVLGRWCCVQEHVLAAPWCLNSEGSVRGRVEPAQGPNVGRKMCPKGESHRDPPPGAG